MGTCGFVGPIGLMSNPGFGSAFDYVGLFMICIILPAVITPLISLCLRKIGWIKDGDLKLDL